ncbi:hypothetical protein OCAR_7745 [Afipia carboxidovorans OM5]|nr:hypothetical protein OCAR_7745 [Afipia carboxidovorans OM5]
MTWWDKVDGATFSFSLQATDRHAGLPRPNERPINPEPRRIAEGFQARCGVDEFHTEILRRNLFRSQTIFLEYSKYHVLHFSGAG